MSLLPLVLSVGRVGPAEACVCGNRAVPAERCCRYCGAPAGNVPSDLMDGSASVCALCGLARHLERPRINEEARLIWLPEMSQAALSALMRRVHGGLRALGERLEADAQPSLAVGERPVLYHAQQGLLERSREAEVRFGSLDPGELADALVLLSGAAYGRREALLGGLRLLPMGRLLDSGEDVYPAIVDSWRGTAGAERIEGRV